MEWLSATPFNLYHAVKLFCHKLIELTAYKTVATTNLLTLIDNLNSTVLLIRIGVMTPTY